MFCYLQMDNSVNKQKIILITYYRHKSRLDRIYYERSYEHLNMLYKHINRAEDTKKAIQKQPVKENADKKYNGQNQEKIITSLHKKYMIEQLHQ